MKRSIYKLFVILIYLNLNSSCFQFTKPLSVETELNERILVIEAPLCDEDTLSLQNGVHVYKIRVSVVSPTSEGNVLTRNSKTSLIQDAKVSVIDPENDTMNFSFVDDEKSSNYGYYVYQPSRSLKENGEYKLKIISDNMTYESTASMSSAPEIQSINKVFNSETDTSSTTLYANISVNIKDIPSEDNYYQGIGYSYRSLSPRRIRNFGITTTFSNELQIEDGGLFPIIFNFRLPISEQDTLAVGIISISPIQGKIINSFPSLGSNPFQPPPPFPRTNIVNTTDPSQRCIGYFSVNKVVLRKIIYPTK